MREATVHPARVMLVDRDLRCFRLRTYGHRVTCPRCDETHTAKSPALARSWLYTHDCEPEAA